MTSHQFGGDWTEEKLERLRKYLAAYMKIFSKNERAKKLDTFYVDAFAGTGYRSPAKKDDLYTLPLFEDEEATGFQKGSARIALETEPPFGHYIFVEQVSVYFEELKKLKTDFNWQDIDMVQSDANSFLRDWCFRTDWNKNRAVIFLDPYGMEVEWQTIEAIAKTQAIDLWLLFPLGQAVNRLLIKNRPPEGTWAEKLTRFFGTEDWKTHFYRKDRQGNLFDQEEHLVKNANFDSIKKYFINRLENIFVKVAKNPLVLCNSKKVPIYLLCFAASNQKGASTAVNIAQDILRK